MRNEGCVLIFFFAKGISSHLWRNLGDCVSVRIYLKTQFGWYWVKISNGRLYHVSTLIYSNFIKYLVICFYMFTKQRYNSYHIYLRLFSKTPKLQKKVRILEKRFCKTQKRLKVLATLLPERVFLYLAKGHYSPLT